MPTAPLPPVVSSRIVSRKQIHALTTACLMALQKHGLVLRLNDNHTGDTEECEYFAEAACAILGLEVEQQNSHQTGRKSSNLDLKTLNQITLECACAFAIKTTTELYRQGTLDQIRLQIVLMLYRMGYENLRPLCMNSGPRWASYAKWEDVARADGLSEENIWLTRLQVKVDDPRNYEESPPKTS